MLIHCTRKLFAQVPAGLRGDASAPVTGPGALGDWHATVHIIERRKCLLFCHDATRFALLLPAMTAGRMNELGRLHRELLLDTLAVCGIARSGVQRAALALGDPRCDTRTDRSVLGSMRVIREDLEAVIYRAGSVTDLDPVQASAQLSHRPASVRGAWMWPDELMAELIAEL